MNHGCYNKGLSRPANSGRASPAPSIHPPWNGFSIHCVTLTPADTRVVSHPACVEARHPLTNSNRLGAYFAALQSGFASKGVPLQWISTSPPSRMQRLSCLFWMTRIKAPYCPLGVVFCITANAVVIGIKRVCFAIDRNNPFSTKAKGGFGCPPRHSSWRRVA